MAREIAPHIGKTANPFKRYFVKNIAKEWTDLVCELADENEALKIKGKRPKHEVYGGKPGRYWAVNRKETVQRNNRYLKEFWKTLPTQDIKKLLTSNSTVLMNGQRPKIGVRLRL